MVVDNLIVSSVEALTLSFFIKVLLGIHLRNKGTIKPFV